MRFILFIFMLFLIITFNFAQTIVSISDGTVNTCNGSLFDSGGQGGSGYSNNENYTLTICPDNPNDIITLDFLNFALSNVSTANPNNADNLTIYDGDNILATTLGSYGSNQLQGLIVTCTSLNTSGCLTLVFESNDQGTGVFAATITCSTPCQRPTASMTMPTVVNNPHRICEGDNVSFDASGSSAIGTFNIVSYIWNWGDGDADTTTTATMNHTYANNGEYPMHLYVIDDNGCINSNSETIKVQVGTEPDMQFITGDTTLCIGETSCLFAQPQLMPVTWTGLPESGLGGATYLPDNVGQCFTADLEFLSFTPGQTLNNANDLIDICVSMEHSFMGDLVASIICPNGQTVILHQQGGGGTQIGDPEPADDPLLAGNCWQYCWSPTATNGTWVDNSSSGSSPNTVLAPISGSQALAPGTYESLNPLSGLVGCELNGTWTIEFCDLWGADDGFVCDWSLQFDPSLYPALSVFTPIIGNNSDSSYWTGSDPTASSFITSNTADMNSICVTPTQAGVFGYDYTVIDNHGCTYDTTLFVTVGNGPTIDAGLDTTICPGSVQLDATAQGGIDPSPTCDYTINMFDTFGDGWNGFSIEVFLDGISQGTHTMPTGGNGSSVFPVSDGQVISFNTSNGSFDNEVSYQVLDCNGTVVFQDGTNYSSVAPMIGVNVWSITGVSNVPPLYSYSWTPTTGVVSATDEDPVITTAITTTYTVSVWETAHPDCASTDDIIITIVNNGYAGEDTTLNFCLTDPVVDLFTLIPNNPDPAGTWYDVTNTVTTSMFDPATQTSDSLYYVIGIGACSDTALIVVNVATPFVLTMNPDTIICQNGTGNLNFSYTGGLGAPYTETWDNLLVGNGPHTVNPLVSTCYNVFVTDANGCISPTVQTCVNLNPPILITVTNTDSVCTGLDAVLNVNALGGNSQYNYSWEVSGVNFANTAQTTVNPLLTTQYCVTVGDACETTPVTECVEVGVYNMPNLSFTSDVNAGCYPINVTFTNTSNSTLIQDIDWDFGNGSTTSGLGPVSSVYTQPICYTVEMTSTTINGCISNLVNTDMICPDDYPVANFTFNPNPTDLNQTTISFDEDASSDALGFVWEFGDSSDIPNATVLNPVVSYPIVAPGNYDITLTVTNAAGCQHDTTYTLIINGVFSLYIPNSFSPNGDGVNETFFPKGDAVDPNEYEFYVFDRDGHILFQTTEFGDSWDGRDKSNQMVPPDVYVWKIKAKDYYLGEKHVFTGHVTMLK